MLRDGDNTGSELLGKALRLPNYTETKLNGEFYERSCIYICTISILHAFSCSF